MAAFRAWTWAALGAFGAGCAPAAPARAPLPVAPAPPPKDDGGASEEGTSGAEHAAALEQLRVSPLGGRVDRQRSVRLLLPDAGRWTSVKFWGVPSLLGFRYGKAHHAIVGGVVAHVPDETSPGACGKAFERDARPWVESFDVALERDPPTAFPWSGKIVDVESLVASTATLGLRDSYAIAYATFPAWRGACLVLGIAVPARDEMARAKAVRDRFVADVLPKVMVMAPEEPKERD